MQMLMCSDLSPSDADAENIFSREAVGRRSMSEKRKAYMDARLLNFYQQAKTVRGRLPVSASLADARTSVQWQYGSMWQIE